MGSTAKERGDGRIRARNTAAILAAATELFAERGPDATTMAAIAERSGLPKSNVHYYFKTKAALWSAITGDLIAQWDAALAHLAPDRDPGEAIAAYIRAKLEFSRRHPAPSRIVAGEALRGGGRLSQGDLDHMRAVTAEKAAVFRLWAEAGRMDPVDPGHLFILLWGTTQFYADFCVHAAIALEKQHLSGADFDRAAETAIHIVLKGCGIAMPPLHPGTAPEDPDTSPAA